MSGIEWNSRAAKAPATRRQATPLLYFLGFILVLFIGILTFCYVVTKRTNPVLLDPHGKPAAASSEHSHETLK